jgi:hypothetical protein
MSEYLAEDISVDSPLAALALLGASHAIQKYTDQTIFYVQDDTTIIDGTGSDIALFPDIPVLDVSEVLENADWDSPTTLLGPENGSNADYDWTDSGLLIRRHGQFSLVSDNRYSMSFGKWPPRRRSVQVTYSHGYQIGGLTSLRVVGRAANAEIDIPGFSVANGDTVITVYDETSATIRAFTGDADGDGIKIATDTTGHSLLVTFDRGNQMPADIQLITVAAAARSWAQDGATQESTGSYSATYAGQPAMLTDDEKRILDRYRDRRR